MENKHLRNVREVIDEIEKIDSFDIYAYERFFSRYYKIKHFPIFIHTLGSGTELLRARTHRSNLFFESFEEIANPKPEFVKRFARCNRPSQSVFYCSENRVTAYMELVSDWAENAEFNTSLFVTIGKWKLKSDLNVILFLNTDKQKRKTHFEKIHGAAFDQIISQNPKDIMESSIEFLNYLYKKFRSPFNNDLKTYLITSSYCNLALMESDGSAQGVMYPSVPFEGRGINLAINQSFAAKNLIPVDVSRQEFKAIENENNKHSFIEVESISVNKIEYESKSLVW